jgi:thioredoxin
MNIQIKKQKRMKRKMLLIGVVFALILANCNAGEPVSKNTGKSAGSTDVIYLTDESFKENVFNYEKNKEWKYEGTKPAIIDFYADWCAPCRELSPMIEELAKEYGDKIVVYKVDTEKEKKLTQTLGISALPTLLFIPVTGKPQVRMGLVPKTSLAQAIDEILLTK